MTDTMIPAPQAASKPEPENKPMELHPAALAEEALALNQFYQSRNMYLANHKIALSQQLAEAAKRSEELAETLRAVRLENDKLISDLAAAQETIRQMQSVRVTLTNPKKRSRARVTGEQEAVHGD